MKIFLIGMMGSGKSFLCQQLAERLQINAYDLDDLIEAKEQKTIEEIFNTKGEDYFRTKETEILKSFAHKENFVVATGGGTACFNNNIEWMNKQGITIWLNISLDVIAKRLLKGKEKEQRPLIKDISNDALQIFLQLMFEQRKKHYEQARITLKNNYHIDTLLSLIQTNYP
ncbi:MAG: AAA family ATPase [Chitinophagaceae bacterium]|nr:AAA family ATPase [Chitinophagaceae bacterium]MCW5905254.1 AAA family ATPase [Chitinophagaceae bacterium]